MTTVIKAIETHYAGCRFRSRLEARWAIFFDTLGIKWEYEPQGFTLASGRRYLPDFWLPAARRWIEVKGADQHLDLELLIEACTPGDGLPIDPEGTPYVDANRNGPKLTILGPVPRPGLHTHSTVWFHKGDYSRCWSVFNDAMEPIADADRFHSLGHDVFAADSGERHPPRIGFTEAVERRRVPTKTTTGTIDWSQILAAYTAARSAQFEHGANRSARR